MKIGDPIGLAIAESAKTAVEDHVENSRTHLKWGLFNLGVGVASVVLAHVANANGAEIPLTVIDLGVGALMTTGVINRLKLAQRDVDASIVSCEVAEAILPTDE